MKEWKMEFGERWGYSIETEKAELWCSLMEMSWCGEGLVWQLSSHLVTRPAGTMKQQLSSSAQPITLFLGQCFLPLGHWTLWARWTMKVENVSLYFPSVTVTILTSVLRKISGFSKSYALTNSYEAKLQHSGLYFCCSSIKTSFTLHMLSTMDHV